MNQALKSRIEQPTHTVAPELTDTTRSSGSGTPPRPRWSPVGPGRRGGGGGQAAARGGGSGALTMRRLAEQLGIKAPSLYKHLPDKTALEAAIIATGLEEAAAGSSRPSTARRLAATRPGVGRRRLGAGGVSGVCAGASSSLPVDAQRAASSAASGRGRGPRRGAGGAGCRERARARALWAFAHGMVMLELDQRFPPDADLDAAWGLVSRRSRRADLGLVWSPCPAWIG